MNDRQRRREEILKRQEEREERIREIDSLIERTLTQCRDLEIQIRQRNEELRDSTTRICSAFARYLLWEEQASVKDLNAVDFPGITPDVWNSSTETLPPQEQETPLELPHIPCQIHRTVLCEVETEED